MVCTWTSYIMLSNLGIIMYNYYKLISRCPDAIPLQDFRILIAFIVKN